ncbi:MAG TPA: dockerin type I domain-containing protein [Planctomycetota bacterium]|nr:dockerin type I domain-containing protein [Planctomycetota bacterium]
MRILPAFMALVIVALPATAAPFTVSVNPSADAFVRELQPDGNFGKAGGLSVSGPEAYSYMLPSEQVDRSDSLIRFPMSSIVSALDAHFGSQSWRVTGIVLNLTEQTRPNNPMFSVTAGVFEVRWIACDTWAEGTGTPNAPTADGVRYEDEPAILSVATDVPLGFFASAGGGDEYVPIPCGLDVPLALSQLVKTGANVNLFLTAVDAGLGFTFNSREISGGRERPSLSVTADVRAWPVDGDANLDCRVNILDLIFVRNRLNQDPTSADNWQADVNTDGHINVLDLIFVRNRLNTICP